MLYDKLPLGIIRITKSVTLEKRTTAKDKYLRIKKIDFVFPQEIKVN